MKSTHKAEVVKVNLEPHPNADSLSLVRVYGYSVCVRTEDWINRDKGVYIVPDSLVDTTRPEFAFLANGKQFERIKVKKLRGVVSQGLLIPCPEGFNVGDDCAEYLGVERYEPPVDLTIHDDDCSGPDIYCPKYDIDSYNRYLDLFNDGESVYISEKLEGCNGRYVYLDGQFYCGSRTRWKKESETNLWWQALNNTPNLKEWLKLHERMVVYGEVYGNVKHFPYDTDKKVKFRAFDILVDGQYLNPNQFIEAISSLTSGIRAVPILEFDWPLDKSSINKYANGKSIIGDHIREGCVIKPMEERTCPEIGRVFLKLVGEDYYLLK